MSFRVSIIVLSASCLAACGGSSAAPSPPVPPAAVSISIVAGARILTTTAYVPNPVNIQRGATVTWTNNDTTTHNNIADGGSFSTPDIPPGGTASVTFQTAGAFQYHCGLHPGMGATINVQ